MYGYQSKELDNTWDIGGNQNNVYNTSERRPPRFRISRAVRRANRLNVLINRELNIPDATGAMPTWEQARERVIMRVQDRRWYRKGPTNYERGSNRSHSVDRSATTNWYVRKYQAQTNTISLSGLRLTPRGGSDMPADGIWQTRSLDPSGAMTGMTGTITLIVDDNGQPDFFTYQYTTASGVVTRTINTDPTGDPLYADIVRIEIPLEDLTSPIIRFNAVPTDPTVDASQSNYHLTIEVDGDATLSNPTLMYGIDGVSADPAKVNRFNKDFMNDGEVEAHTTRRANRTERKREKRLKSVERLKEKRAAEKERKARVLERKRNAFLARSKRKAERRNLRERRRLGLD